MIFLNKVFNGRQWKTLLFLFSVLILFSGNVKSEQIILYDATGQFAGYLDPTYDSIYLASGEPVAYINKNNGAIYGFNGNFLGWYSDGVVRDVNGYIIGFSEANAPKTVILRKPSDIRFIQKTLPRPPIQTQVVVERPVFSNEISPTPFSRVYVYPPGAEPVK